MEGNKEEGRGKEQVKRLERKRGRNGVLKASREKYHTTKYRFFFEKKQ